MSSSLIVNLAFLGQKYTGLTTYAKNIVPELLPLNPILLTSNPVEYPLTYPVSPSLTQEGGTKANIRRLIWNQRVLTRIYRQKNADLLFCPIPEAPLSDKCRYIVTVHDLIPLRFAKLSPLTLYNRYYIPEVLKGAKEIIAVSEATAGDVCKFFDIKIDKIKVIYSGYDRAAFRPLDLPVLPYFIYIGRYDPHKNIDRLLDAFAGMKDNREYELLLVGQFDSRFTPPLQVRARELGIGDRVKFLNYVPYGELPILLNQALALVYPSLWEGFGLPVLEAMACGTPVITSNISSLPEVAGNAAILIDPYNTAQLSDAMERVAGDSRLRDSLKNLSLQRAAGFSWQKTGERTREVLEGYL